MNNKIQTHLQADDAVLRLNLRQHRTHVARLIRWDEHAPDLEALLRPQVLRQSLRNLLRHFCQVSGALNRVNLRDVDNNYTHTHTQNH